MPRSLEEMLGNYDIEVVPVEDKYIVTWKSLGSDEAKAQIFDSSKDAERFTLSLNPTRAIGILRKHFSRGEIPSYDEMRNARKGMKELERELRTEPTMIDRIRAIKAIHDLDVALRDAERTGPTYTERIAVEQALLDLQNALEEIEPVPERGETVPGDWGERREVRVRGHLRRRIVRHLESPPSYCLCKRSKTVDRVRRSLIRRLK
jgi:hypothetical protein